MKRTLPDYLADTTRRRWQYGSLDCCTFMADWLVSLGFTDPMADRRGTYSTEREYRALIRSEGGIVAACSNRFAAIGMAETDAPKRGDVMLVSAPFAMRRGNVLRCPTGSICASDRFRAVLTPDRGLVVIEATRLPLVRAWTARQAAEAA